VNMSPGFPARLLPALAAFAAQRPGETWLPVQALASGPVNCAWLLRCEGAHAVIRLAGATTLPLGIDREREARIQARAAAARLAPEVFYADPAAGVMVSRYVEPVVPAPGRIDALKQLGLALGRLHRQPTREAGFDCLDHATGYLDALSSCGSRHTPTCRRILESLESGRLQYRRLPALQALCHCDPNPANVLFSKSGVCLIDWEYAAVTDPTYDLAAVIETHALDLTEQQILVSSYGRDDVDWAARLGFMQRAYRLVSLCWYALLAEQFPGAREEAERMMQIDVARLQALEPSA